MALAAREAVEGGSDPRPLLAISSLFGELADQQVLIDALHRWLSLLYTAGTAETLLEARRTVNF